MLSPAFIKQIEELGIAENANLIHDLTETAPSISVRLNKYKTGDTGLETADAVPWLQNRGFYLDNRPNFTQIPQMHQGLFYVQDASSMFIAEVIRQLTQNSPAVTYLDACAAPGGKTTAAIDALPSGSLIVANEYDFHRANILKENVIKWGYPGAIVSRGDTKKFAKLKQSFDIIAADVPCSGEGMFRKDAEAVNQWTLALVEDCAQRQKQIISNLWAALRPGGCFIYSTCTFNRTENEDIILHILEEYDAESVEIVIDENWGIVKSPLLPKNVFGYRFIPGRIRGEGLFMSVLRKKGEFSGKNSGKKQKKNTPEKASKEISTARVWLKNAENYTFTCSNNIITAFPAANADFMRLASGVLDIIHAGIPGAEIKGKDIIPCHALAMSTELNINAFPVFEADMEMTLKYLRREAVTLPSELPRGFVLITFGSRPLGFVKNIGNRANNLYPEQWRILH